MTERPIRDILAEVLRRERLGLMRPLWQEWQQFADEECELVRQRADHVIRLLDELGVTLVRTGDALPPAPPPQSPVIWRYSLTESETVRLVRKGPGDQWEIVKLAGGEEKVELAFSLASLSVEAGMVLRADPEALKLKGLMTRLAAGLEIFRVEAETMEYEP